MDHQMGMALFFAAMGFFCLVVAILLEALGRTKRSWIMMILAVVFFIILTCT